MRERSCKVSVDTFLAEHTEVYSTKHGSQLIYLGRDEAKKWWLYRDGKVDPVEADISEEAQAAAHQRMDEDEYCTMNDESCAANLVWKLVPRIETNA
jgi:hypothetical protein